MPVDPTTPPGPGGTGSPTSEPIDAETAPEGKADQLQEYRQKRDFTQTTEPAGGSVRPTPERPFFCVQKHAASALHYDLRLEVDGVLKSWAVPKGPSPDPADKRLAVKVEDHPLEYGSFEGAIPEGEYGAGTVLLWDRGWWEPDTTRMKGPGLEPSASIDAGELKVVFHGEKLQGSWTLVQMKGRGDKNWLLIKHRDGSARSGGDLTAEAPLSVATGRTIEEIAEDIAAGRVPDRETAAEPAAPESAATGETANGPRAEKPGAG